MTGRCVDGFLGQLWVYFDIIILGQPLGTSFMSSSHTVTGGTESLCFSQLVHGLGRGMVIPPEISPARLIQTQTTP
jgi:hypothetical protein